MSFTEWRYFAKVLYKIGVKDTNLNEGHKENEVTNFISIQIM